MEHFEQPRCDMKFEGVTYIKWRFPCSGLSWKSCRSWSEFWEIQTSICKEMFKNLLVLTKSCRSRTNGPALVSNTVVKPTMWSGQTVRQWLHGSCSRCCVITSTQVAVDRGALRIWRRVSLPEGGQKFLLQWQLADTAWLADLPRSGQATHQHNSTLSSEATRI